MNWKSGLTEEGFSRLASFQKPAAKRPEDAPRIYVGTYAKYNNGSIEGAWLDLEDYASAEDFYTAARELHSDEEDPELMFQDWENIPDWAVSESHIDPKFWEYMEATESWGAGQEEAFKLFADSFYPSGGAPDDIQGMIQDFEDRYRGEYRSMEEFAQELISDLGIENIQNAEFYFDAESFGRDLGYDGYYEVDEEEAESEGLRGGAGVYDPENQFTGYQTLTELAQSYFDEGMVGAEALSTYFDYEKFGNDLEMGGDYTFLDGHVFANY